jgi:hypothetical protein
MAQLAALRAAGSLTTGHVRRAAAVTSVISISWS